MDNLFHILKASEGGPDREVLMSRLRAAKIPAVRCGSPYIGCTGIQLLTIDKRKIRKAERIVFGPLTHR